MRSDNRRLSLCFFLTGLILMLPLPCSGGAFPLTVTDSAQNKLIIQKKPRRVVCLVPYITEMIGAFGREQVLVGLTRQDLVLYPSFRKNHVGGYFHPDIDAIAKTHPDLIIAAPFHKAVIQYFGPDCCPLMVMETKSIADAFYQMEIIGQLFDCEKKASEIIQRNREQLALVKSRLGNLPVQQRKRVVRVMAGTTLSCPGDDSFQNEIITAAGGIPPKWGKNGFAVPVSQEQWQQFNSQMVYGCSRNEKAVQAFLKQDGWKDVAAVQNGFIRMFPCNLTCQVSTRVGYFVQWLATVLYLDLFADPEKAVTTNAVLDESPVVLGLDYVKQARVVRHRVADSEYKSLVIRFNGPQEILSTFEGNLTGILGAGNTYVPMPASLGHMAYGVTQAQEAIQKNLGFAKGEFSTMMTGADMDNLAVVKKSFKDLEVTALVTAGVKGNAMRMSKDTGQYFSHGTINIIVMTNRTLPPNARARSIITATEAKSAALLDMDVRSSYTPLTHRATGTGTDNIMVVQGDGPVERFAGGHSKIGELIAKAVHAGVTQAILKQNGLAADRDLFQRLTDRKLRIEEIVKHCAFDYDKQVLISRMEKLLATPYYSSFIESALSISDDYEKGLIKELNFFDTMCCSVTARLSGKKDIRPETIDSSNALPIVMAKAFDALISGITGDHNEK
ncbi:adenosylcobinamide amidohydrolase [Desulfobacula toluolica]|uniref:Periplasmic binding protein modulated with adenosylcobinamide aminohydrolase, CbiZ n=1 Tax=Desulfobacula toluolica (strain DSM 7467 / Tol2) TaxID=651182 RepID=K0NLH4_DESTT|nr:adenosylcobinamide amidohydrolase [Desulfobacula toluolica]CCK81590.1 periplasmic binding protein modulated with adenosylcobinamide aminohydrolase, CbiZ [Desulfobacula toluolica Tol2]